MSIPIIVPGRHRLPCVVDDDGAVTLTLGTAACIVSDSHFVPRLSGCPSAHSVAAPLVLFFVLFWLLALTWTPRAWARGVCMLACRLWSVNKMRRREQRIYLLFIQFIFRIPRHPGR